jgi:hypothetical protein
LRQPVSSRRTGVAILALALLLQASPAQAAGTFADDDGNVHEAAIEAIAAEGITLGCREGLYCPDEVVTRGQMASFLQRALDLPTSQDDAFGDDQGSVHEAAINAIAEAGITEGCDTSGTRFCPSEALTRAQMASLLMRSLSLPAAGSDVFVDDEGSVHEEAINAIAAAGVTAGCDESGIRFCPDQPVRRDQMASFLARALGLFASDPISCTRVVGFSQTEQWFTGGGFEPVAGDAGWELLWEPGATIEKWAAPDFVGWSNPIVSACTDGSPDRLVLTVTGAERPVARWVEDITAAVATAKVKYPGAAIVLQPIVGGPDEQLCPGVRRDSVRASVNHPIIDQAIGMVVAEVAGVATGASPEVRSCADYRDDLGHLTDAAVGPIGEEIAEFYAG